MILWIPIINSSYCNAYQLLKNPMYKSMYKIKYINKIYMKEDTDIDNDKDNEYLEKFLDLNANDNIISNNDNNGSDNEMSDELKQQIEEMRPSDMDMRLQMMGFNPLTYFGFALAGIIIFLNITLGYGWSGDLLAGSKIDNKRIQRDDQSENLNKMSEFNPYFPIDKLNNQQKYIIIEGKKIEIE